MTPPKPLERALTDPGDPPMRPLPPAVTSLLLALQAPPRLAAHLRAVHDVAHELADWTRARCPGLPLDREAVFFGAATHDIGKTVHEAELSGPGSAHEEAGRALLLAHGFPPALARFAGTHASWARAAVTVEELLVSVADKVWKNQRVPDLEDRLVARLAEANGTQPWEEFLALDDVLSRIGEQAARRLAFQASFPVRG
ncbi:HD domain-containing protein [Streptomyces sp. NPDC088354]|uniref:HD domain-containing protein n=1 Tax=Streptomyces sp. NPDC088354 TaxID=3365856 RepID=UPI0037F231CA